MKANNKVVASSTKGLKQSYQHLGNRLPNQGIFTYLVAFLSKAFTAIRASMHKRYKEGDSSPWSSSWSRPVAWMPLAILLLIGLILLRKDFNLNINLTAPHSQRAPAGIGDFATAQPTGFVNDDKEQAKVVAFVREHVKVAAQMKKDYGVPMSVQFAAALAATDGERLSLLTAQHNPFGVTCHAKDCPKGHCSHLDNGPHKTFYRNYNNLEEGWKAFCTLVTTGKYRDKTLGAADYKSWVEKLDEKGYWSAVNTSKAAILEWIDKYQLAAFDGE